MNPRPFEQLSAELYRGKAIGRSMISPSVKLEYRLDFYNRDECRDFKSECIPLGCIFNLPSCQAGIAGKGWFLKPHSFWVRFF